MRKIVIMTTALTLGAVLASGTAMAKPSLRDVAGIEDGLFAVSVADKIRRECDTISGRFIKARSVLLGLYETAREQGYSDDEIDAYVNAKSEKNRMRAKRDKYLAGQGVVKSDPTTYCAAGRAEIRKSSQIGALLRAR